MPRRLSALLSLVLLLSMLAPPTSAQQTYPSSPVAGGQPQQQLVQQQAQGQAPPPQAPPGFQLNQLQQAFLIQVLDGWQQATRQINTFSCPFERLEFNNAFGPAADIPLTISAGELSYSRPDKGSFQITEIKKWTRDQAAPGQQPAAQPGKYVVQESAIGEHWVCDGKSVYEYRHEQKQLVERPIPPSMQGQAIMDGPLPFLFGAERNKLMARYWLRVMGETDKEIWLEALPKDQRDAANFKSVKVILDRQQVLPKAMEVNPPDGSRHVYKFDLAKASINSPLARLGTLFSRPRKFGYTHVVENIPEQQAAAPGGPAPR